MKMILIAAATFLTAAIGTEASAASLISVGGSGSGSLINVAPQVKLLNGNDTSILSGLLSRNSILNDSNILSGNKGNGLLGLGILSGNNSNNGYGEARRGCGCR